MTEFDSRGSRGGIMPQGQPQKKGFGRLTIIAGIVLVLLIGGIGFGVYHHAQVTDYSALNPKATTKKQIEVKSGSSAQVIAAELKDKGIIRSDKAFVHYVDTKNVAELKAGYYLLSPSMTIKELTSKLTQGGSSYPLNGEGTVTVREGENADAIATEVANKTKFSKKEFLAALNDSAFLGRLKDAYPGLLDDAINATDVRYKLEGYLYPATYDVKDATNVREIINQMVANDYTQFSPYFDQIKQSGMNVQQVMTLASLIEREGVSQENRNIIAGVFLNRIKVNMPLASDVAVKYALNTDKANLSNKDVKVDSPYNLYANAGYGPGPFDSPTVSSVKAVLNPQDQDKGYLFFVANLKTGEIYYSKTYDEQLKNTDNVQADNDAVGSASSSSK